MGAPYDNSNFGAAWIFTRSGGVWTQQGPKLVGTGAVEPSFQGYSVSISADGNTAIVGGVHDNSYTGAAWIFTRTAGVWTQQGSKLIGSGAVGIAAQGASVALSGDGMTAIVGGLLDTGAAWIFVNTNGVWSQQGSKLDSDPPSTSQGSSVSLSSDGNTAIVGAPEDNSGSGAVWVYTRSGGVWTQQGSKLVGAGAAAPPPHQGMSVSLSGDGNSAIFGSPTDNGIGAAWIFVRSGAIWTQRGPKLVGGGGVGGGFSVALSADGKTAILGGPGDNGDIGAAWIFFDAPRIAHDFNGDGKSDILWRDTSGNLAVWLMNGGTVAQAAGLGAVPGSFSVVGQKDFDGGGDADLLWRDASGNLSMWFMNGTAVTSAAAVGNLTSNWGIYGTADLDGNGMGDLLLRDSNTGTVAVWYMNGSQVASTANFGPVSNSWTILGDGNGGILWRDTAGDIALWAVQGGQVTSTTVLGTVTSNFVFQGIGDFDGDGNIDILWRDTNSGALSIWFTNATQGISIGSVGALPSNWSVAQIGDYDGDGKSDILLLDNAGDLAVWLMNGATVSSSIGIGNVGTTWQVQNVNAN